MIANERYKIPILSTLLTEFDKTNLNTFLSEIISLRNDMDTLLIFMTTEAAEPLQSEAGDNFLREA